MQLKLGTNPQRPNSVNRRKLVIAALLLACIAAFFLMDLSRFLTLEFIKTRQAQLSALHAAQPAAVLLGYFAVYVLVAALSLPGAAILTLAGGASFGLVWGTVVVSLASTIGATLAMLTSRYLVRDVVAARFGRRLNEVNKGMDKDGALYLLTLRLIPALPFFVVNLLMGLTHIRTWTYFWVSQLGMLAGTLAYVNAGTQLAKVDSLRSVLSPGLIASFALLGLLPLGIGKALGVFERRKVYARWKASRPRSFDCNLVVIGAGAGGLVSAYIAAAVKAKVTLIESHKMGGDCLNYGCVPSKTLIRSARLAHQMRNGARYGLSDAEVDFSFKAVMQRVKEVIHTIEPHDSPARYASLGVDVLQGHARIINPWTIEVALNGGGMQQVTTRSIVIAAGARPVVPELPGLAEVGFVTSDTLWDVFSQLDAVPKRLAVLGGGPIGCELAQAFARLGAQVTLVDSGVRLLSREDEDVSSLALAALQVDGVRVLTSHQALRCEKSGDRKMLWVACQGKETVIEFDELICAVGREARLTGYGLEELGIPVDRTVQTNDYLQTIYPNIYAAGDVAGPYQLTHVASHQAWYAAVNGLFGDVWRFKADYSVIPRTTFIDPEIARVGLSEAEAKAQNIAFEVTKYGIADLDRAIADSEAKGFVKVLTATGKDRILGVTIVGNHAGDLLAEYVLAMRHGLGLNKILSTIHTYPTMSEANKYAAGQWKQAHQPKRLLAWVRRYHDWKRN